MNKIKLNFSVWPMQMISHCPLTQRKAQWEWTLQLPLTSKMPTARNNNGHSNRLCHRTTAGYEAQIWRVQDSALKHGVTIANAPGTIDSDYRGEIAVILLNNGNKLSQLPEACDVADGACGNYNNPD